MKPVLSVLLPIHNERENLPPLFGELEAVLGTLPYAYEIIAVDDGSNDGSAEYLAEVARRDIRVKVIVFRRRCGQTAAFDAGFRHARGELIVTMDSDGQSDPHDIPKMLDLLQKGNDFVAGWRRKRKDNVFFRTLPSRVANLLIRTITGTKLHDLGCSLKAYRREFAIELRLYGEMHRFIGVLMEYMGAKTVEIEVNHRPRLLGKSKYNLVRTVKVLLDLVTLMFLQGYRTKPNYVFGGMGIGLMMLSMLITGQVLIDKFGPTGALVHRNPLFIIAVFLAIVATQFFVLGLLAELVTRTYFESTSQVPYSIMKVSNLEGPERPIEKAAMIHFEDPLPVSSTSV